MDTITKITNFKNFILYKLLNYNHYPEFYNDYITKFNNKFIEEYYQNKEYMIFIISCFYLRHKKQLPQYKIPNDFYIKFLESYQSVTTFKKYLKYKYKYDKLKMKNKILL